MKISVGQIDGRSALALVELLPNRAGGFHVEGPTGDELRAFKSITGWKPLDFWAHRDVGVAFRSVGIESRNVRIGWDQGPFGN